MKTTVLELRSLSIGYAGRKRVAHVVAEGLMATLREGEFVCLLGPNGAGKSTLIQTLTRIRAPLGGSILFDGRPIGAFSARELAKRLSVVLTQRVAAGMMPVEKLVALGRYPFTDWAGKLSAKDREAVVRAMAATGIEPLAHRPFCELSDGEQQKVMIARALAQEPRVMILDEPTAFLDLPRRVELMHLLGHLAHESGRAVLMATHELDLALRCADRLWLLPSGQPLVEGTPEDLVLRGAFSSTFASRFVRFDPTTGSFRSDSKALGLVAMQGGGTAGMWTSRALERVGYKVVSDGEAETCVEVASNGTGTSWCVRGKSRTHCASLDAVLESVDEELGDRNGK
jgi:iron complex transport system ATP-binding protein